MLAEQRVASASAIIGYGHEELLAFDGQGQGAARRPAPAGPGPDSPQQQREPEGPEPKGDRSAARQHPSKDLGLGYPPPSVSGFPGRHCGDVGRQAEQRHDGHRVRRGAGRRRPGLLRDGEAARDRGSVIRLTGADGATHRNTRSSQSRSMATCSSISTSWSRPRRAPASCSCAIPNNPSSTIHKQSDVEQAVRRIKERSPQTAILIDEAYIDYATAPGVGTAMKVALELPGVFVTRTFSKAYGMAGMRMGYAIGQPETIQKLSRAWGLGDICELQAVAGIAALADQAHMDWERQENKRVRDYTIGEFKKMGYRGRRFADQLHLREHRPAGRRIPRRLPRAWRRRRPRLPADGKDLGAHLARQDGRHGEGGAGVQEGARQGLARRLAKRSRRAGYAASDREEG